MNLKRFFTMALAMTMSLTVLSGCGTEKKPTTDSSTTSSSSSTTGSSSDATGSSSDATATPTSGTPDTTQELNLVFTDLKTLDVNDVRNANEFQVLSQVHEGLFRAFTDDKGNEIVQPAGCESYTVSDDGTVYTFKIRDQKWSDGVAVTAQQYVDSFRRLINPDLAFSYSFMAYDIKNAKEYYDKEASIEDVGVKAIDDKTFEVTLKANIPFFVKKLTNVCFFPIRLDVIESAGDAYLKDFTKHVFNGPFIIESRILENEMILAKNPSYWDAENVKLQKVTFKVVPEAATQSLLLESKELDAVAAQTEYINKWKSMVDKGNLEQISVFSPSVNYMCFNQHTGGPSKLMNNAKARLALSLALDRNEFNELVYDGINTPAYSLIPFGMMVGDKEFRTVAGSEPLKAKADEYNTPEKIKALFIEGMKEEGLGEDPSTVTLTFITTGQTAMNKAQQEFFTQQWESKLGVKINMNVLADSSLFVAERNGNKYDVVFMGWNGDYSDPMTFMELWNTGSGYAKFMGGYHNAEFDKMFDSLSLESDNAKRAEIYTKMEQNLVADQAGVAPLYFQNTQIFKQSYVKNFSTPTFGTQYEFSRAYIEGK